MGKQYFTATDNTSTGLESIIEEMDYGAILIFEEYKFPENIRINQFSLYDTEDFVLRVLGSCGENSLFRVDSDGFTTELREYDMADFSVEVLDATISIDQDGENVQTFECKDKREANACAKRLRNMILKAQKHLFILDQRSLDPKYIEYSHDTWL